MTACSCLVFESIVGCHIRANATGFGLADPDASRERRCDLANGADDVSSNAFIRAALAGPEVAL